MKPALIVLAKDPVPGRVKTRLAASIGDQAAACIYKAMVRDLLEMLAFGAPHWSIEVHLDQSSKFYERFPFPLALQAGGGLGAKLHHCLSSELRRGAPAVTVIGSDAPALHLDDLRSLMALEEDVSFGPTEDGGFWGIQARKTSPRMFNGVRWSTANALSDALDAAHAAGLSTACGPHGWDVDEAADLDRATESAGVGKHTMEAIARWRKRQAEGHL